MLEIHDLDQFKQLPSKQRYIIKLTTNVMDIREHFDYIHSAKRVIYAYEIEDQCIDEQVFQLLATNMHIEFEFHNLVCSVESKILARLAQLRNVGTIIFKTTLSNALSENSTLEFASQISQLRYLEKFTIDLAYLNNLGSMGFKMICEAVSHLIQLKELTFQIGSLNIGPQGAKHLSDCLKHLINLEGLDLFIGQGNLILSEGGIAISESFPFLQNLRKMQLLIGHQNKIEDPGIIALTDSLSELPNLSELHLLLWCHDNMGLHGGVGAMKNIAKLKQLQYYDAFLKYNRNTNQIFDQLPENYHLEKMTKFKVNFWPGTAVGPLGAVAFGQSLKCLQTLQELYITMQSLKIGSTGAISIGEGIGSIKSLQKLTLIMRSNEIGNEGMRSFIQAIGQLSNLEKIEIDLDVNQIDQLHIFELCEIIGLGQKLTDYQVQIKDSTFKCNQLIEDVRSLRKQCQEQINSEMDFKTNYYLQLMNMELAQTIAIPKI